MTHLGSGQTEIRATYQDHFGGAIVLVNVAVTSITVTCAPDTGAHVCTAVARLSNGVTQDVTRAGASWSSSNTSIATVDSTGRVTHLGNGQVEIGARFQSVVGGVVLTLSGVVTVASVSVTCTPQFEAHQCAAVANFSDGSNQNVTAQAAWTSSNAAVATVDSAGLVRHRVTGQVEIRAAYKNVTGSIGLDLVVGFGSSVVINEFSTGDTDSSLNDYVELRNDSSVAVDISGWELREWNAATGTSDVKFVAAADKALGPGCHYLVAARNTGVSYTRDAALGGLNNTGGLALLRSDGTIVDQVGYSEDSPYREGTPLPPDVVTDNRACARVGNDTNDNSRDFVLMNLSPRNSTSSCTAR